METPIPRKLWEHPNPTSTQMWKFKTALEKKIGRTFPDFQSLYQFSCTSRSTFWLHCLTDFPLIYTGIANLDSVVDESAPISSVPRWFAGIKMNFAQNIFFQGDGHGNPCFSPGKEDDKIACVEVREGSFLEPRRNVTWKELRRRVGKLSQAMRARGLKKGDRVAVVASHSVDTLICFLAVTALGGMFSSSSTDMGVKGVLDRLLQIKPRWLFMDDAAVYNGRKVDLSERMAQIVKGMARVKEFHGVVSQPRYQGRPVDISAVPRCMTLAHFEGAARSEELVFESMEFSDPFLIVYSSGTTGQPKCIVHSIGGVILNAHKEGRLHRCVDENTVQLQYTTTGWIMYLISVQALLMGARMVMYDGSPFVPDLKSFIRLYGEERVTHLGISPKYLHELQKNRIIPQQATDQSSLEVVTSTGMVLPDKSFDWFYDKGFPQHVQLDNISGGTDIAGTFATGNPLLAVYVGGCQSPSLGTPIAVYDQIDEGDQKTKGVAVQDGTPGELVATAAFPNMPVMFWGDEDGSKYFSSYFGKYDGSVWVHGDFIMIHPVTKTIVFLGRADGVLNPSGVRFGSAEIYSVIDAYFADKVSDSICVGQRRPKDTDESVMLFVLMKPGVKFSQGLVNEIQAAIRKKLSARHMPKYVFETPEIPTTVNLKKVELPVKQIVSGRVVKPSGTLLNPRSLDYYYRFAKVEELVDQPKAKL